MLWLAWISRLMDFDSKLLTVFSGWITDRPPIRHGLPVRQILILLMLFQYLRAKRCLTEDLLSGERGGGKSETLERGQKICTKHITTSHRNCSIWFHTLMNETKSKLCVICRIVHGISSQRYYLNYWDIHPGMWLKQLVSPDCVWILREDCISSSFDFKRHSRALIHPSISLQISYGYMSVPNLYKGVLNKFLANGGL